MVACHFNALYWEIQLSNLSWSLLQISIFKLISLSLNGDKVRHLAFRFCVAFRASVHAIGSIGFNYISSWLFSFIKIYTWLSAFFAPCNKEQYVKAFIKHFLIESFLMIFSFLRFNTLRYRRYDPQQRFKWLQIVEFWWWNAGPSCFIRT